MDSSSPTKRAVRTLFGIDEENSKVLEHWVPPSSVTTNKKKKLVVMKKEPRLGLNVEALQKDHAIIVDEFVESLTLTTTMPLDNNFASIYDRLQSELDRVLHSRELAHSAAGIALARDVQHIASIMFSLMEHERAAVARKVVAMKQKTKLRESNLIAGASEERRAQISRRLAAGASLVSVLARTLLRERPLRRRFNTWLSNTAWRCTAIARQEAQRCLETLRVTDMELHSKRGRVLDLEASVATKERACTAIETNYDSLRQIAVLQNQRRVFRRLQHQAFHKWRSYRGRQLAFLRRTPFRQMKTLRRLAFSHWRSTVLRDATELNRRHILHAAIALYPRRCLYRAYNVWKGDCQWRRDVDDTLGLKKLSFGRVRRGFQRWRSCIHACQQSESHQTSRTRHLVRFRSIVAKLNVTAAFRRWVRGSHLKGRCLALLTLMTSRRRLTSQRQAWRRWDDRSKALALRERHVGRCHRRQRDKQRSLTFRAWAAVGRDRRRRDLVLRRIIKKRRRTDLIAKFRTWYRIANVTGRTAHLRLQDDYADVVQTLAVSKETTEKALAHRCASGSAAATARFAVWSNKTVSLVFFKWVFAFRDRRGKYQRSVATARKRRTQSLFDTWARRSFVSSRLRTFLRRIETRTSRGALQRSFGRWHVAMRFLVRRDADFRRREILVDKLQQLLASQRRLTFFSKWRSVLLRKKRAVKKIQTTFLFYGLRRLLGARFRLWAQFSKLATTTTRVDRVRDRVSARLRRRSQQRTCGALFKLWRSKTKRSVSGRRLCRKVLTRWYGDKTKLAAALRTWWLAVAREERHHRKSSAALADTQRRTQLLDRCRRRFKYTSLARAWNTWTSLTLARRQVSGLVRRRLRWWTHSELDTGFRRWRLFAEKQGAAQKREVLVDRCRRRMRLLCAAKALGRWQQFLSERQRLRKLVRTAIVRMVHGHVVRAWTRWRDFGHRAALRTAIGESAARRMRFLCAAKAVGRWKQFRHERRRFKVIVRHLQLGTRKLYLTSAWRRWATRTRLLGGLVALRRKRHRKQHKRIFVAWLAFQAKQRHTRALLVKLLLVKAGHCLKRAFSTWTRRPSSQFLNVLVHRVGRGIKATAFSTWRRIAHADLREALHDRVIHANQAADEATRTINAVVGDRLKHRALMMLAAWRRRQITTIAFRRWDRSSQSTSADAHLERVADRLHKLRVLGRIVSRWRETAASLRRAHTLSRRVVYRMLQRSLAAGFTKWKRHDVETRRRKDVFGRIRRRMLNAVALRALNSWTAFVAERHRLRRTVRRVLSRWVNQRVSLAFGTWYRGVQEWKRKLELTTRHGVLIDRVKRRMAKQLAFKALNAWTSTVKGVQRRRKLIRRVWRRFQNTQAARALRSWRLAVANDRRSTKVQAITKRMLHVPKARAFGTWVAACRYHERVETVLGRGFRILRKDAMNRAFRTWIRFIGANERYQRRRNEERALMMRTVIKRLVLSRMYAVFRTWQLDVREAIATETDHRRRLEEGCAKLCTKILRPWAVRFMNDALRTWQLFVLKDRHVDRMDIAASRLICLRFLRLQGNILRSWRGYVAEKRRLGAALSVVEKRSDRALKVHCFEALAALRRHRSALKQRALRWQTSRLRHLRAVAFRSWQHLTILKEYATAGDAAKARTAGRYVLRILEREATVLTRRAFDKFVQHTDVERVKHEAHVERMTRRTERRQKALTAIHLLNVRLLRKIYIAWSDHFKHSKACSRLQACVLVAQRKQRTAIILTAWRRHIDSQLHAKRYALDS